MRITFQAILCFCAILWMVQPTFAQSGRKPTTGDTSARKQIIIDHITKLVEDKEGPEPIKWLSGGLWLHVDSTYIKADSAVIFGQNRADAYGNVVIRQGDSLDIFSDTLFYTTLDDVARLPGEVVLQQGTAQLWTRDLDYHLSERVGIYTQSGVLVDGDLQLSSKAGKYFAGEKRILFTDSVVVLHPKFSLVADSLYYLVEENKVLFTGPTNIYLHHAEVYCESGYYDLNEEVAEFRNPAQYAGRQKKVKADVIRYDSRTGEVVMRGNVYAKEIDKIITGDSLFYNENSGETVIFGHPAHYTDSTRTLVSPEIYYNERTSKLTTKGRSEAHDGSMIMVTDNNDVDPETGYGLATGNVIWRDTVHHIGILRADTVVYGTTGDYLEAYGYPRQMMYVVSDGDTLYISADSFLLWQVIDTIGSISDTLLVTTEDTTMYLPETRLLTDTIRMIRACHHVLLFKSNMQGKADSLIYHGRDSMFTFFGDPVLWSDTTQFSGDTISVSLKDRRIHHITLIRNAMLLSEILGEYYDQIRGRILVARFDSTGLNDMSVNGNAESVYYTRDEQSAFIGVNQTVCSKMFFTFKDGRVESLKYYGENSSVLSPMSKTDHDALRLEGFRWRADERPVQLSDLLE